MMRQNRWKHGCLVDTIREQGLDTNYYESYPCDCVAATGHPSGCALCDNGVLYRAVKSTKLLVTSINTRKNPELFGLLQQGGVTFTVSKFVENKIATIEIGGTPETDDVFTLTVDANDVVFTVTVAEDTIEKIVDAIVLASNTDVTVSAIVTALKTSATTFSLTPVVAGVDYTPSITVVDGGGTDDQTAKLYFGYALADNSVWDKIHVNDVIVVQDRVRREHDFLKRGTRDILRAFEVEDVVEVRYENTIVDPSHYTYTAATKTFAFTGTVPVGGEYIAFFDEKINYKIWQQQAQDRGSTTDVLPKKSLAVLRAYYHTPVTTLPSFIKTNQ